MDKYLAKELGITGAYFSKLINNKAPHTQNFYLRLVNFLDIEVSHLKALEDTDNNILKEVEELITKELTLKDSFDYNLIREQEDNWHGEGEPIGHKF